jgi:hypothetical protein
MSESLQARPGDLYKAASKTSLLPIGMLTPVALQNLGREVYVVVGDVLSNCNSSSAFSVRMAVGSVKVKIWNEEPLMRFQMCL